MQFWNKIGQLIKDGQQAMLLCVLANEGSSPGKQGFKMAVFDSSIMLGSIGGGMMEQKLIELAKIHLQSNDTFSPFLKRQIHNKDIEKDQSGMICQSIKEPEKGWANYNNKASATNYISQFDDLWERGTVDKDLRQLEI